MRKLLPFKYPIITSYPEHAFLLAGLTPHNDFMSFLYSNYIQLYHNEDSTVKRVNFYTTQLEYIKTPFVDIQRLPKETIKKNTIDIIDFTINSIEQNYYLIAYINEYFIPESPAYLKYDFPHMILIYGYDSIKETFNTAGFFNNFKFMTSSCTFTQFRDSYINLGNEFTPEFEYMNYLNLYSYNHNGRYTFDLRCVIQLLTDYYECKNTSERFRMIQNPCNGQFGLDVYNFQNQEIIKSINNNKNISLLSATVLLEHKKCMISRINYMKDNKILSEKDRDIDKIIEKYKKIEIKCNILRQLMIKFNLTRNFDLKERMLALSNSLVDEDKAVLEDLIKKLSLI